jgi:hypothetical protein
VTASGDVQTVFVFTATNRWRSGLQAISRAVTPTFEDVHVSPSLDVTMFPETDVTNIPKSSTQIILS